MKVLITVIAFLIITTNAFGGVVLYRYTDKATGDERGICYSSKNGTAPIANKDWDKEVISESQKAYYVNKHKQQVAAKKAANKALVESEKTKARGKLKTAGYSNKEIDAILGETKNIIPNITP